MYILINSAHPAIFANKRDFQWKCLLWWFLEFSKLQLRRIQNLAQRFRMLHSNVSDVICNCSHICCINKDWVQNLFLCHIADSKTNCTNWVKELNGVKIKEAVSFEEAYIFLTGLITFSELPKSVGIHNLHQWVQVISQDAYVRVTRQSRN